MGEPDHPDEEWPPSEEGEEEEEDEGPPPVPLGVPYQPRPPPLDDWRDPREVIWRQLGRAGQIQPPPPEGPRPPAPAVEPPAPALPDQPPQVPQQPPARWLEVRAPLAPQPIPSRYFGAGAHYGAEPPRIVEGVRGQGLVDPHDLDPTLLFPPRPVAGHQFGDRAELGSGDTQFGRPSTSTGQVLSTHKTWGLGPNSHVAVWPLIGRYLGVGDAIGFVPRPPGPPGVPPSAALAAAGPPPRGGFRPQAVRYGPAPKPHPKLGPDQINLGAPHWHPPILVPGQPYPRPRPAIAKPPPREIRGLHSAADAAGGPRAAFPKPAPVRPGIFPVRPPHPAAAPRNPWFGYRPPHYPGPPPKALVPTPPLAVPPLALPPPHAVPPNQLAEKLREHLRNVEWQRRVRDIVERGGDELRRAVESGEGSEEVRAEIRRILASESSTPKSPATLSPGVATAKASSSWESNPNVKPAQPKRLQWWAPHVLDPWVPTVTPFPKTNRVVVPVLPAQLLVTGKAVTPSSGSRSPLPTVGNPVIGLTSVRYPFLVRRPFVQAKVPAPGPGHEVVPASGPAVSSSSLARTRSPEGRVPRNLHYTRGELEIAVAEVQRALWLAARFRRPAEAFRDWKERLGLEGQLRKETVGVPYILSPRGRGGWPGDNTPPGSFGYLWPRGRLASWGASGPDYRADSPVTPNPIDTYWNLEGEDPEYLWACGRCGKNRLGRGGAGQASWESDGLARCQFCGIVICADCAVPHRDRGCREYSRARRDKFGRAPPSP